MQNSSPDIVFKLLKKYNEKYFMLKNVDGHTVLELKNSKTRNNNNILTGKCDTLNIESIKKNLNNLTVYINYFNNKIKEERKLFKSLETKTKKLKPTKPTKKYSRDLSGDFKEDESVDEKDYYDYYKDDYEENTTVEEDEFRVVTSEKVKERYIQPEKYDIYGKIAIHIYNGFFEKMLGVHGLWPETNKKYLDTNYMLGDTFRICKNFSKENGEMNDNLMQHEWEKHGVYSGYAKYRDYFKKSCELAQPIIDMIKKIPAWNDKSIKDEKIRWTRVKEYVKEKYKNTVVIKEPINDKIVMNHELYFPVIKKANQTEWEVNINI